MDAPPTLRPLLWVGASKKEFLQFPREAVQDFGFRLHQVQADEHVPGEKLLVEGLFRGLGIRELRADFDRDTYRVVYTVKLRSAVYVLHAFKKKSRFGISTPMNHLELVRHRYQEAVREEALRPREQGQEP